MPRRHSPFFFQMKRNNEEGITCHGGNSQWLFSIKLNDEKVISCQGCIVNVSY